MYKINDNYLKLPGSYLFSTIARKVSEFTEANPNEAVIRLGIGDVTQPLAPAVVNRLHDAVDEMSRAETFRGYSPEGGGRHIGAGFYVQGNRAKRGRDIRQRRGEE